MDDNSDRKKQTGYDSDYLPSEYDDDSSDDDSSEVVDPIINNIEDKEQQIKELVQRLELELLKIIYNDKLFKKKDIRNREYNVFNKKKPIDKKTEKTLLRLFETKYNVLIKTMLSKLIRFPQMTLEYLQTKNLKFTLPDGWENVLDITKEEQLTLIRLKY